jgi:hypothetical protein
MRFGNVIREVFNPWVILGSIGLGACLLVGTLIVLNQSRSPRTPVGIVTAALTVIPAPTDTPLPATPTEKVEDPTPELQFPPSPQPGVIAVGAYVQVSGTEGEGLRLRAGPGLEHNPDFLGLEGEVFVVQEGPQDADGYTWWYLVAPADTTRTGWAVSNFLEVIQNP